jgi:hypothetical protein
MRRALLLAALALPGPCTTFDGVSVPVDAGLDAGTSDVADAGAADATCGLSFDFEPGGEGCQQLIDQACCIIEQECAKTDACAEWIACVNACPKPRADGGCYGKCGSTSSFSHVLNELSDCRAYGDAETRCRWP